MKQWLRIRYDLYTQIRERATAVLGKTTGSLGRYESAYEKTFLRPWKTSTKEHLIKKIRQSRIVLLADFHALQQSQKAHLRILKSLPLKSRGVLAVEFFESKHQKHLDDFMEGKVSEKDFLKKIQWETSWGFPWEHYRPLVRWAQKQGWRVLALDDRAEGKSLKSLKQRDAQAAALIAKALPDQVFVIFGDLHLAEGHLPREIMKSTKIKKQQICTVFQNSERIYFQLLRKNLEVVVDVVQLKSNQFCLMNVPPWVKWQNYLLYLEKSFDPELGNEGLELTDEVVRYLELLGKELGFSVGKDHFSVFTAESPAFWEETRKHLRDDEIIYFQSLIENNVSFYLPQIKTAFLAQASVNHAAVVAMAIWHAELSRTGRYPSRLPEDFTALIWLEAVLYFGSKIINPKRKTDTLSDLKLSLSGQGVSALRGVERDTLQLALQQKMREILFLSQGRRSRETLKPRKKSSYREASRLLGGMLGEKLFFAYRRRMLSHLTLKNLLSKPLDHENFRNIYFEILEMVELLPEPFKSKREKL